MQQPPRKLKLRERLSPYFETGLAYFQYLGLIYEIDLPWPAVWNTFLQWATISTLASEFNLTGTGEHAVLDARAHFLVLTVLLPLALSFIMLIFAKPIHIIVWFFALLFGVGLLAAGIALVLLGIAGNGKTLAMVGGALIVLCGIIFGVRLLMRREQWIRKTNALRQALRERRERRKQEAAAAAAAAAMAAAAIAVAAREGEDGVNTSTGSMEGADSPVPQGRNSGSLKPLLSPSPAPAPARVPSYNPESRAITHRVFDQEREEEKEAFENAQLYKVTKTGRKSFKYILTRFLASSGLILAGVLVLGYFNTLPTTTVTPTFYSLRNIFGPILVALGGVLFIYLIVNCTKGGRERIARFKSFLEGRFIWAMLLALTTLYIPFTTTAFGAMRCVTLDCVQGYQPPVARKLMLDSAIAPPTYSKLTAGCVACSFVNNCTIAETLCQPTIAKRLAMDLSQPCNSNIPWMMPVTIITGLAITFGTPLLFYRLIVKHTRMLENIPAPGEDRYQKWEYRCSTTRNSAKMLYHGFTLKWRFYRMLLVLQRLLLSLLTIFLYQEPLYLAYITLGIHFFFFLFNLAIRPYRNLAIDGLAVGTGGGLIATCALGVTLAIKGDATLAVILIVLIIDIGFPTLSTGTMMWVQKRRNAARVAPIVVAEMGEKGTEGGKGEEKEKDGKEKDGKEKDGKEKEKDGKGKDGKEKEKKPLDVVDLLINDFTLKTMSNFFMIAGLIAFLGLAIGIVGILYSNNQLDVVAPVLSTTDAAQQFVGYTSWAEFTDNCCCLSSSDHSLETWKCANGYFKERLRSTGGKNGFSIRSFCNTTFSAEVCSIPATANQFKAAPCSGFHFDDYTAKYLW